MLHDGLAQCIIFEIEIHLIYLFQYSLPYWHDLSILEDNNGLAIHL